MIAPTTPRTESPMSPRGTVLIETITSGRAGVMPAWNGRLDPVTIKALTVYVHSLGGGK